jgi:pimeloyl-ACP methyl ester carboxylesterase
MDDLDELRQALGYDKINVFGGSYGTRAALVYLRQHGDHVRTLTLEAVAPPQYRIPLRSRARSRIQ